MKEIGLTLEEVNHLKQIFNTDSTLKVHRIVSNLMNKLELKDTDFAILFIDDLWTK